MNNETGAPEVIDFGELPPQYKILRQVGRGASGVIFHANDIQMEREVAIKILTYSQDADRGSSERFEREARVLAGLNHQNIVRILASGFTSKKHPYHVLEWVAGENLAAKLQREPILPMDFFLEFFCQVLEGLTFAHANNVLHRDIKPSNLMVCEPDESGCLAKIVDFGIAREISKNPDSKTLTQTAQLLGSPAYMSPEQCRSSPAGRASDIYSISCVMYECLAGQALFDGKTDMEIMYKHLHQPADLLDCSDEGRRLYKLIASGLDKDADKRPHAQEFLAELSRTRKELTGRLHKISTRVLKKRTCLKAGLFLAAIVLILVGAFGQGVQNYGSRRSVVPGEMSGKEWLRKKQLGQKFSELDFAEKSAKTSQREFDRAATDLEKHDRAVPLVEKLQDVADRAGDVRKHDEQESALKRILNLCPLLSPEMSAKVQVWTHRQLSNIYFQRNSSAAADELRKALAIANSSGNKDSQAQIYSDMAGRAAAENLLERADTCITKVIELLRATSDIKQVVNAPDGTHPGRIESLQAKQAVAICRKLNGLKLTGDANLLQVLRMNNRLVKLMIDRDDYNYASEGLDISFGFLKQLRPNNSDYAAARRETYLLSAEIKNRQSATTAANHDAR